MFTHVILCIFFVVNLVDGHLKDMGEVTVNWTAMFYELEDRIVGGEPTNLKRYPFNVQFFNYGGMCGGTILTSKTVMTAAHCFDHNRNIAEMTILSNSRFIFDPQAHTHEVWDFKVHEYYNTSAMFSNDIALILVHYEFQFDENVKRAVLCDTDTWMNENEVFEATGWGEIKYKGELSNSGLMRTHLRYVPPNKCMKSNKVILTPDIFCLFGDGQRDTCKGDSGGGILWNDVIVGIVSHGNGCAVAPAMYTNVFYFRTWIYRTIRKLNESYCQFHKSRSHVKP
ncbi:trypsin delta-like [Papilio machaon]|uniref:trypsin delta-like n=1 Tax=Papilio machaon TaxID=76193 RepID=UPI001E662CCF|nr:trypsin delta-like [Papilio machaon]